MWHRCLESTRSSINFLCSARLTDLGKYCKAVLAVANQGLDAILDTLVNHPTWIAASDECGGKALIVAAGKGHDTTANLLLEKGVGATEPIDSAFYMLERSVAREIEKVLC